MFVFGVIILIIYSFKKSDTPRLETTDGPPVLVQAQDVRKEIGQYVRLRVSLIIQYISFVVTMIIITFSGCLDAAKEIALLILSFLTYKYTKAMDLCYREHNRLAECLNLKTMSETDDIRLWGHYCKFVRVIRVPLRFDDRPRFFYVMNMCMPIIVLMLQLKFVGWNWLFFIYSLLTLICSVLYLHDNRK